MAPLIYKSSALRDADCCITVWSLVSAGEGLHYPSAFMLRFTLSRGGGVVARHC